MAGEDQVQYPLRIDKDLYEEVRTISKLSNMPISKFILAAIERHAVRQRKELQRSLSETLEVLKQYAAKDPEFTDAIDKVADAEMDEGATRVEGKLFDVREGIKEDAKVDTKSLEEFLENA